MVDLHRRADLVAAHERDGRVGVRVVQRAGGHRVGAPLDRHVRLVDEVPVEDVVAGVAAVVAAWRGVVVGPRLAERGPAVVVAPDAGRDLRQFRRARRLPVRRWGYRPGR